MTLDQVYALLGPPDADIGSGVYIFVYRLDDGSTVPMSFAGGPSGEFAFTHQRPNGTVETWTSK
jgi:hypothetical protein